MGWKSNVLFTLLGLILYLVDMSIHIPRGLEHWQNGNFIWFSITFTFILLSHVVSSIYGMVVVKGDSNYGILANVYVSLFFGLTLTLPFILMVWGFVDLCKGKQNGSTKTAQIMMLLEVVIQALFLTCLQTYILGMSMSIGFPIEPIQWISLLFSILSLSFRISTGILFEDKSYVTKIIFFILGGLSIASRIAVFSMFSLVHYGIWVLPICIELTAMIILWFIKNGCACCSREKFEPIGGSQNNAKPFSVIAWIINTFFNSFSVSGILVAGINLTFAIVSFSLLPSYMFTPKTVTISLSSINIVANIMIVVCPPLKYLSSDWSNSLESGPIN